MIAINTFRFYSLSAWAEKGPRHFYLKISKFTYKCDSKHLTNKTASVAEKKLKILIGIHENLTEPSFRSTYQLCAIVPLKIENVSYPDDKKKQLQLFLSNNLFMEKKLFIHMKSYSNYIWSVKFSFLQPFLKPLYDTKFFSKNIN